MFWDDSFFDEFDDDDSYDDEFNQMNEDMFEDDIYASLDPLLQGPKVATMADEEFELWKQVLELARQLYKLKPWSLFDSNTWITIEKERSKFEDATAAFMGQTREDYALQFFLSDWGRWTLAFMKENEEILSSRLVSRVLYRLNAYRIDYVAADELPDRYRAFVRDLGFTFRGNWPLVSTMIQGKPMSYPNTEEIEHIAFLLEGMIQTVEDIQAKKVSMPAEDKLLKRYWSFQDQRWLYRESGLKAFVYMPVREGRDELMAKRIAKQMLTDQRLSVDLLRFRTPMLNPQRELVIPSCFIATDDDTAQVVKIQLLMPEVNELEAWEQFIVDLIQEVGKPELLSLDDEVSYEALEPFFDAIDISVALAISNPDHDTIFDQMDHIIDLF